MLAYESEKYFAIHCDSSVTYGIRTLLIPVHPSNAPSSISATLSGIWIPVISPFPANASAVMPTTGRPAISDGITTSSVGATKGSPSTIGSSPAITGQIPFPIWISAIYVIGHPFNSSPNCGRNLAGIITFVRFVQPVNASIPISMTESRTIISVNATQSSNA